MAKYICLIFILFVNLFQVFGLNSEINGSPIISTIYYMAVKNGNTLLLDFSNKGISELQSDGKLSEIQIESKLNEKNYNKLDLNTSIITLGLIIAILLIILGFIWIWYLYLQIKKKTKSLDLKNQELQKSEEKFRIITENSTDVIYQLDSSFNLTYISASDEELRGYKKEEIMGDSLFSILKPEGIELIMKANKKRMIDYSNGAIPAPLTYEVEELCKDGSWVWVEATASAYFDKDGKISGYMGVSRDITERRKNEQLLNEKESQLRELISTKDKLFSIIAHDLRSPFNAILGFSELLIEDTNDFEVVDSKMYLKIINSSAKNTLILLDNLLNWAKAQTGQIRYKPQKTILSVIIREILEVSNSIAKLKSITLNYIHADEIEVYADLDMLKTILRNLISNAIKYTHSDGKIDVSAIQNQNNIDITVSDNGVGMSEETRNKLFNIDTNITTKGTQNEKGSGLGLMLCKEFVERHGGLIWVDSELGKGSVFVFSLPLDNIDM